MRVVVDTNVLVSGLIARAGAPARVLDAVRRGELEPVMTWELVEELVEVLRRPKLRRHEIGEVDVDDVLTVLAPFLPAVDVVSPVRDPGDAPIVAAAVAGRAEAIVTGDRGLLEDDALQSWLDGHGVQLLSPRELLDRLS